jgi:3-O-methylgallate 3,4-dioxygenase
MAEIVLGLACSHTPQVSSPPEFWSDHGLRDSRNTMLVGSDGEVHTFEDLRRNAPAEISRELTEDTWVHKYERIQIAMDTLATALKDTAPDVVVVIGDDQQEMFLDDGVPAFAIFCGDRVRDMPLSSERLAALSPSLRSAAWAHHGDVVEEYPTDPDLGTHVVEMMRDEFDLFQFSEQPKDRPLSHAFTFVRRRVMTDRIYPMVPVAVNTYNSVNQPPSSRCFRFGRGLGSAIEGWEADKRVAVIASGGLSHIVVNEELDRKVMSAIIDRDEGVLEGIPRRLLQSGTAEILNWVAASGALEKLDAQVVDYVPGYRSEAGTGVGMAFAIWS